MFNDAVKSIPTTYKAKRENLNLHLSHYMLQKKLERKFTHIDIFDNEIAKETTQMRKLKSVLDRIPQEHLKLLATRPDLLNNEERRLREYTSTRMYACKGKPDYDKACMMIKQFQEELGEIASTWPTKSNYGHYKKAERNQTVQVTELISKQKQNTIYAIFNETSRSIDLMLNDNESYAKGYLECYNKLTSKNCSLVRLSMERI